MRILWVEDDIDKIRGLLFYTEKLGANITEARTYSEAVNILNSSAAFDIAIVDLIIPVGAVTDNFEPYPGIDVCRAIRKKYKDLPIIVMSVVRDSEVLEQLSTIGINKILRKDRKMV